MCLEGLIDKQTAILRLDAEGVAQFLAPSFDPRALAAANMAGRELARGLPAGGVGCCCVLSCGFEWCCI